MLTSISSTCIRNLTVFNSIHVESISLHFHTFISLSIFIPGLRYQALISNRLYFQALGVTSTSSTCIHNLIIFNSIYVESSGLQFHTFISNHLYFQVLGVTSTSSTCIFSLSILSSIYVESSSLHFCTFIRNHLYFQVLGVVSTSDGAPINFSQETQMKTNVYEID